MLFKKKRDYQNRKDMKVQMKPSTPLKLLEIKNAAQTKYIQ